MATFDELFGAGATPTSSASGTLLASRLPQPTAIEQGGSLLGDTLGSVFNSGAGAFGRVLDLLTIPGSAGRNLLMGRPDYAVADLLGIADFILPDAIFGKPLAERFLGKKVPRTFSEDVLKELGVQPGFLRTTAGFLSDLALDPINAFGAPLGKAIGRGATTAGKKILTSIDRLAEEGSLSAAAALNLGSKFSKSLQFRKSPGFLAGQRAARGQKAQLIAVNDARATPLRSAWEDLTKVEQADALDLFETPGVKSIVHADEQQFRTALGEGLEFLPAAGETAREVTGIPGEQFGQALRRTQAREKFGATSIRVQNVVRDFLTGDKRVMDFVRNIRKTNPDLANRLKGVVSKVGREQRLVEIGALTPDMMLRMVRDLDLDHLTHLTNLDDFGPAIQRELATILSRSRNTPLPELRRLAKRSNVGKARKIAGRLNDIEARHPGAFSQDLIEIARAEGRDFANIQTAADFIPTAMTDPRWTRPAQVVVTEAGERAGARLRPIPKRSLGERRLGEGATPARQVDATSTASKLQRIEQVAPADPGFIIPNTATMPGWLRAKLPPEVLAGRVQIRKEVWQDVEKWIKPIGDDVTTGAFGKFWDKITRHWVGYTLPLSPGFHARNAISNIWMNYNADVGLNALDSYADTRRMMQLGVTSQEKIAVEGGKRIPIAQLYLEMLGDDIMGSQYMQAALDDGPTFAEGLFGPIKEAIAEQTAAGVVGVKGKLSTALKLLDPEVNPATRAGYAFGRAADEWFRMTHYLAKRRSGLDRKAAADSVRKSLYGLDELTDFERTTIRPLAPFWSWTRFNVPRAIAALATKPQKIAKVANIKVKLDQDNLADIPEAARPAWFQNVTGVPVAKRNGRLSFFVLNGWWPDADLDKLESLNDVGNFVLDQLHPIPKRILEGVMNRDLFWDREIERFPGETEHFFGVPIRRTVARLARTVGIINQVERIYVPLAYQLAGLAPPGTSSNRLADYIDDWSVGERLLKAAGLRPAPVNVDRQLDFSVGRIQRQLGEFKGMRNRAEELGHFENARRLEALIAQLETDLKMVEGMDAASTILPRKKVGKFDELFAAAG